MPKSKASKNYNSNTHARKKAPATAAIDGLAAAAATELEDAPFDLTPVSTPGAYRLILWPSVS